MRERKMYCSKGTRLQNDSSRTMSPVGYPSHADVGGADITEVIDRGVFSPGLVVNMDTELLSTRYDVMEVQRSS